MNSKLCVTFLATLFIFDFVSMAPSTSLKVPTEEIEKELAKFIQDDKEVAEALKNIDLHELNVDHSRKRRDAIDDDVMDIDGSQEPPKEPGFFDRAAKFVMEVLQRFLKWINTDN